MPINPSIAMGYRAPRIQQPDPEAEMSRGLQLKSMLMQQRAADEARADDQAQRDAFRASGGDEAAYLKNLMQGGNVRGYQSAVEFYDKRKKAEADRLKAAADLKKTGADTEKVGAETAGILSKNDAEKLAQHNNLLAGVASVDDGRAWVQLGLQSGAIKPDNAPMILQTFERAQTPEQLRDVVNRLSLGMKDYIEKNKPTYQTRNTGGSTDTISMPGLGGPVSVVNSVTNTQSPDNAASNARMAADAKAAREQSERHFKANKELQREKLEFERVNGGKPAKPMPASAVKLQNEELETIGTFAGLDADLEGIQSQLAEGKLDLGPVKNLVNRGRNFAGISTEESRNLATLRSKMENMRNAVLLLNKGVQTEGDAQRAMNEIMENLNDPRVVAQRLTEIRALNKRAIELRKNNLDLLRDNYGQDRMDYGRFERQPAATNLGGASVSFDRPAGKQVVRTGTQNGRKVVQYSDGSIEYAD